MRNIALKSSIFNILGFSFAIIANLVITPIFAKNLGINLYGVYSFIITLIGFMSILDFGFSAGVTKFISEFRDTDLELANKTFILNTLWLLVLGFAGSLFIFLGSDFLVTTVIKPDPSTLELSKIALKVASIGFMFRMFNSALFGVMRAYLRYDLINIMSALRIIVMYAVIFILLLLGNSFIYIILTVVSVDIIVTFYAFMLVRRTSNILYIDKNTKYGDGRILKAILNFSLLVGINNILSTIYFRVDKFIVGNILGASYIGYYSVAFLISSLVFTISGLIFNFLFPYISNLNSTNREQVALLFSKSIKYAIAISALLSFNISASGNPFLIVWMGKEFYTKVSSVIPIMSPLFFFSGVGVIPYYFYNALGKPKINLISTGIGAGLYFLGCLFLTEHYGITGTALSLFFGIVPFPVYFSILLRIAGENQLKIWFLILRGFALASIGGILGIVGPKYIEIGFTWMVILAIVFFIASVLLGKIFQILEIPELSIKGLRKIVSDQLGA